MPNSLEKTINALHEWLEVNRHEIRSVSSADDLMTAFGASCNRAGLLAERNHSQAGQGGLMLRIEPNVFVGYSAQQLKDTFYVQPFYPRPRSQDIAAGEQQPLFDLRCSFAGVATCHNIENGNHLRGRPLEVLITHVIEALNGVPPSLERQILFSWPPPKRYSEP